jgi:Uma2 family endonuclease
MGKGNTLPSELMWEIGQSSPEQGQWSEREYLGLQTNRLIEFSKGVLEFLPMPTTSHQLILQYLLALLCAFVTPRNLGIALLAGIRVRLWAGEFREPDIVFMAQEHADRIGEKYWKGADLVMEVVSGGREDRKRDLVDKRAEYARAKIGEYWIVDPREERITVLRLTEKQYVLHGEFAVGETATSCVLPGFAVDVSAVFAQKLASRSRGKRPSR